MRLQASCAIVWIAAFIVSTVTASSGTNTSLVAGTSTTNETLSAYCDSILQNFFSTYVATQIATTYVPGYDGFGPTNAEGQLTGPVTSQSYWTSTYTYTEYPIRAYTAKPPCCSQCYLSAGTMQLIYWPNQQRATKPTGLPSTYTNDDGFTFTSPSVYMAFTSLYASNKCGTVGTAWQNTTLAFDANEITTLNPTITSTIVETKTVGSVTRTITNYVTSKPADAKLDYDALTGDCSITGGYYSYWAGNPFNAGQGAIAKDPCRPILKIPERVISAQPEWAAAGCKEDPGSEGFYDPPITLDTAKVLAVPTFASTTGSPGSSTAGPSQSATAGGATASTARPAQSVANSGSASATHFSTSTTSATSATGNNGAASGIVAPGTAMLLASAWLAVVIAAG